MNILELIHLIQNDPSCEVKSSQDGIPLPEGLPDDVRIFFEETNGIQLFKNEKYVIEIIGREYLIPINKFLYPIESIDWDNPESEASNLWYLIAQDDMNSQFISIDLTPERYGQCYDSFIGTHSLIGDTSIIAKNFTELLQNLYLGKGQYWYWLQDDFQYLGDAYDPPII